MFSIDDLSKIVRHKVSQSTYDQLLVSLEKLDSKSTLVYAHFIGQILHESGDLRYTAEIASGDAYEGRVDLGNTQKGDGRKFKGAGYIQLTGRANYSKFSEWVNDPKVMDGWVYVAKNYPWMTATWYWNYRGISKRALNDNVTAVTKLINGGTNGLSDRMIKTNKVKTAFGLPITF